MDHIFSELNADFEEQFGDQIREFLIEWADAAFQAGTDMSAGSFLEAAKTSICGAIQSIDEEEIFADEDY